MLVPFNPPPGINSDDTAFSAEGSWADGNNVRFRFGKPETVGGSGPIVTGLTGAVRAIAMLNSGGAFKIATATKLYSRGASTTTDVTPTPAPSSTTVWSLDAWGTTVLLANPSSGTLYEQTGTSAATAVTQAPSQIGIILVTPQRQVLALGCNEEISTTFNGLCIRGSDLEDYTDWTTSPTNNAFEHILDNGGAIMGAKLIGDYVAVWTQDDLYLGQFIGDPGQTYRFDHVADGCGLANANAVTVLDGYAYWVGQDFQLKRWAPGSSPETIPCPILRDVLDNKNNVASIGVVVAAKRRFGEVWIYYLDDRDEASENSRYFAYSATESNLAQRPVWFRGILERSAVYDSGLVNSSVSLVLYGDGSGNFGFDDDDSQAPASAYIQSADQYLDNSRHRMMIRGVIPDLESQSGDVDLTLFMRDRPQSTPVTKGPYTLANTANKKDFRASGKIAAIKFSATAQAFRLGKPLFDMVATGER